MQPGQRFTFQKSTKVLTVNDAASKAAIQTPGTIIRTNDQGSSQATNIPTFNPGSTLPSRIKFTMDNTADSVNAKIFYMFDAIGANTSVFGGAVIGTLATAGALTAAIINLYLYGHDMVFSGFRAQATTSSNQFTNPFMIYRVDLDGSIRSKDPINVEDGLDGKTYDNKIQNFRGDIYVDPLTAISVSVNASEKLQVSMFVKADFNRA